MGTTQKTVPKETIIHIEGYVMCTCPNDLIYDFKGYFESKIGSHREPLALENTLWADTVLAS